MYGQAKRPGKKDRALMIDFFAGAISELFISYAIQDEGSPCFNMSQQIPYMMHLFERAIKEE